LTKTILVASLVASAYAACPNSCSGHGTCGANEVCTCYDGWGMGGTAGGDCSDRFCAHELAWVDAPDKDGKTHQYAECAARGICDRETGECECFGGFEGKACGRQTCPDSCSGHGTCEYMNELTFGTVYNDYYDASTTALSKVGVGAIHPGTDYNWDADRARACSCDAGWSGINCAARMCPYGNDVMDTRLNRGASVVHQVQTITFYAGGDNGGQAAADGSHSTTGYADFLDKTFALRFTSKTNETYTTVPLALATATAAVAGDQCEGPACVGLVDLGTNVKNGLEGLPNHVVSEVAVTVTAFNLIQGAGMTVAITFSGDSVHGQQNMLEVVTNPCADGCTPLLTGLMDDLVTNTNTTSFIKETTAADYNSFECGRRGKCDFDTGLCACFEGYTGEACTSLSALV